MAKLPDPSQNVRPLPAPSKGVPTYRVNMGPAIAAGNEVRRAGNALFAAGSHMEKVRIAEEDRLDTLHAEKAFNSLRAQQLDLTVGENGYVNAQGEAATGPTFYTDNMGKFDSGMSTIRAGLANDRQRDKFDVRAGVARLQYGEGVLRHGIKETEDLAQQTFETTMAQEPGMAAQSYKEPGSIQASIAISRNAIEEFGDRRGWTEAQKTAVFEKQRSTIHMAVFNNMIEDSPTAAKEYFNLHKKEIEGTKWDEIRSALKTGGLLEFSQGFVDEVMLEVDPTADEKDFLNQQDYARSRVRGISEPQRREAARIGLDRRLGESNRRRAEYQGMLINGTWEKLFDKENPITTDDINPMTLSKIARIDPRHVTAMQSYVAQREARGEPDTNYTVYGDHWRSMGTDPQAWAKMWQKDGFLSRDKLSDKHFEQLTVAAANIQMASDKSDAKASAARFKYATANSIAKHVWEGSESTEKMQDKPEAYGEFQDRFYAGLEGLHARKTEVTEFDVRELAKKLVVETGVDRPGTIFGPELLVFEAIQAIPQEWLEDFKAAAASEKIPYSDDLAVRMWEQQQNK